MASCEELMPTESIRDKVRRIYKNKDRRLLEKYGVIDPDSPIGTENGISMEELTEEGAQLLEGILWAANRDKVLEVIKKVDKEETEEKEKNNK